MGKNDLKPHRVSIKRTVRMLIQEYEDAKVLPWIEKPISYALYKTWKYVNSVERDRNEKRK